MADQLPGRVTLLLGQAQQILRDLARRGVLSSPQMMTNLTTEDRDQGRGVAELLAQLAGAGVALPCLQCRNAFGCD